MRSLAILTLGFALLAVGCETSQQTEVKPPAGATSEPETTPKTTGKAPKKADMAPTKPVD